MKHIYRFIDVTLIVLLISLFLVPAAFAQDGVPDFAAPFAPILAATVAIERFLQLIRNLINPDPEQGILARKSKALTYYTTIGGVGLGLAMVFMSDNLRLLSLAGINFNPLLDGLLTGVAIGLGSEFVHEVISVIGEGKQALRFQSQGGTLGLKSKRSGGKA